MREFKMPGSIFLTIIWKCTNKPRKKTSVYQENPPRQFSDLSGKNGVIDQVTIVLSGYICNESYYISLLSGDFPKISVLF